MHTPAVNVPMSPPSVFEAINYNAKILNGTIYIIVVNSAESPSEYLLENIPNGYQNAVDIISGQTINITNNTLLDTLMPLEVRVFKLSASSQSMEIPISSANKIIATPNPAQTSVHIRISDSSVYQYVIFNSLGAILKEGSLSQENGNITIAELRPGTYFIKLTCHNNSNVIKIVKQ